MLENELLLEQRQVLTTKQLQSLEILAFTNQELNTFLTKEYLENPILEEPESRQEETMKNLEAMYEKGTTYKEQYIQYGEDDCSQRGDIPAAEPDEMEEFLLGQLDMNAYTRTEWGIMKYMVQCLDERGFFPYEPEEIARSAKVPADAVKGCLVKLKTLEPIGIFSRDVPECLMRQLEQQGVEDEKLMQIVRDYMPDLLQGRISAISRGLKISTARVKEYINQISHLNPRPIMSVKTERASYIVPDILADYEKGRWEVSINDKWMGDLRFNDYYIHMMQQTEDGALKEYFREKYERARFLFSCVEQRRSSLISIAEAILEFQEDFFLTGAPLKPMCMEEIAQKTGLHVSTVSRAVRDKYIQYRKVYLIRSLFTAPAAAVCAVSVVSVKDEIRRLIEGEDTKNPLSDFKITEIMKARGIELSRRTVAKYRMQMGIPESRYRMYLEKRK